MPSGEKVGYLVFDVESVADGGAVSEVRYRDDGLEPAAALRRYRDELLETKGTDFIPYSFQVPISVVVAKVAPDFRLLDLVALDAPNYRPHVIADLFWRGWSAYRRPTMVSFNGRGFDLPLMELAAFRYGLDLSDWFDATGPNYSHPRYRYNVGAHLDLHDLLTNFGAARLNGGLNLVATLLGKPGKMSVQGDMVQDLYDQGQLEEINDYCRCDVLDTYFVFLRASVMVGKLKLSREQEILSATKEWLQGQAETCNAFREYLDHWGDWTNPWKE